MKENFLWIIVVILVILWLLGFFGRRVIPNFPQTASWIRSLLVIAVILIVLKGLGIIQIRASSKTGEVTGS